VKLFPHWLCCLCKTYCRRGFLAPVSPCVYVVSLVLSLVFKTNFITFLAPLLWFVSNLENKKCMETSQSVFEEYADPKLWKVFLETSFEFIGQFFFQNYVFKFQEIVPELGIIVFLENGTESFQRFLILQIRDKLEMLTRF
jgi:hypothetical protein